MQQSLRLNVVFESGQKLCVNRIRKTIDFENGRDVEKVISFVLSRAWDEVRGIRRFRKCFSFS